MLFLVTLLIAASGGAEAWRLPLLCPVPEHGSGARECRASACRTRAVAQRPPRRERCFASRRRGTLRACTGGGADPAGSDDDAVLSDRDLFDDWFAGPVAAQGGGSDLAPGSESLRPSRGRGRRRGRGGAEGRSDDGMGSGNDETPAMLTDDAFFEDRNAFLDGADGGSGDRNGWGADDGIPRSRARRRDEDAGTFAGATTLNTAAYTGNLATVEEDDDSDSDGDNDSGGEDHHLRFEFDPSVLPPDAQLLWGNLQSMAGTPEAVNALQAVVAAMPGGEVAPGLFRQLFPFDLDRFQLEALAALAARRSVVVSAPTGSGKTVAGELAIYYALALNLRVFYTTPLKALSNQKFSDFRTQFGAERVGLLTGDTSVNRDAQVCVMTTEVFRNMLYTEKEKESSFGAASSPLLSLFAVVFDEFHWMNDRDRGTVWEESVISCPPHVLLVALSATMGNVDDVRGWIAATHGPAELVTSDFRPVPLRYWFANRRGLFPLLRDLDSGPGARRGGLDADFWRRGGGGASVELDAAIDGGGSGGGGRSRSRGSGFGPPPPKRKRRRLPDRLKINEELLAMHTEEREMLRRAEASAASRSGRGRDDSGFGSQRGRRRGDGGGRDDRRGGYDDRGGGGRDGGRGGGGGGRFGTRSRDLLMREIPSYQYVVRALRRRELLPAIVFIFSRAGCDRAAADVGFDIGGPAEDEDGKNNGDAVIADAPGDERGGGGGGGGSGGGAGRFGRDRSGGGGGGGGGGGRDRRRGDRSGGRFGRPAGGSGGGLLTTMEAEVVRVRLAAFRDTNPQIPVTPERAALLLQGIATHHAGLLPVYKAFVEDLFAANLVKVVFATETLAAGVNMPARTTVITSLSKRGDTGIVKLEPSQLLQMAGRAGRRGKDTQGSVVLMRSRFEDVVDAHRLLLSPLNEIESKFRSSYSMAVNVLRSRGMAAARTLVEKSFGNYLQAQRTDPAAQQAAEAAERLAALEGSLGGVSLAEAKQYRKLWERQRAEARIMTYLMEQERDVELEVVQTVLPLSRLGSGLLLRSSGTTAILLGDYVPPEGAEAMHDDAADRVVVLTRAGAVVAVPCEEIRFVDVDAGAGLPMEVASDIAGMVLPRAAWPPAPPLPVEIDAAAPLFRAALPASAAPSLTAAAAAQTPLLLAPSLLERNSWPVNAVKRLAAAGAAAAVLAAPREVGHVSRQRAVLGRVTAQVEGHPVHVLSGGAAEGVLRLGKDIAALEDTVRQGWKGEQRVMQQPAWTEFLAVCRVLQRYGALEGAVEDPVAAAPIAAGAPAAISDPNSPDPAAATAAAVAFADVAAAATGMAALVEEAVRVSRAVGAAAPSTDGADGGYTLEESSQTVDAGVGVAFAAAIPAARISAAVYGSVANGASDTATAAAWKAAAMAAASPTPAALAAGPAAVEAKGGSAASPLSSPLTTSVPAEGGGDGPLRPTPFGELVGAINAENELWLALVLSSTAVRSLTPQALAALVPAVVNEYSRPDQFALYGPSPAVSECIAELAPLAQSLLEAQFMENVDFPVRLDGSLCGLVESWAAGADWAELVASTSLDQGDLCRLLRRSMELLRQIPVLPGIPSLLKDRARAAVDLLDRFPASDDASYLIADGAGANDDGSADAGDGKTAGAGMLAAAAIEAAASMPGSAAAEASATAAAVAGGGETGNGDDEEGYLEAAAFAVDAGEFFEAAPPVEPPQW